MRRNNDRMLLESLVRKYGKNGVKNAIRRINENVNSDFELEDGVLIGYHGNGGKVIIPQGVTTIGVAALARCNSITSVIIPDSVTEISEFAFCDCTKLTSVKIPNSVTEIGECAFCDCASLVNVNIPNGVKIGKNAFKGTKINKNKNLINEMAHNKPYVTEDNVERIIGDLRNTYPEIHHTDIRAFFGGWQNGVWEFEPEWFDDIFTWAELVDAFDDWLNDESY